MCLRRDWHLVRIADSGESGDLPAARLRIEALGVARFRDVKRDVHERLDECHAALGMPRAHRIAVRAVWADHRDDRDDTSISEQQRGLAHPAHRLGTAGRVEPKTRIEAQPDVVAIEPVREPARLDERSLERHSDRALACAREPREPHGASASRERIARGASHLAIVPLQVVAGRIVGTMLLRLLDAWFVAHVRLVPRAGYSVTLPA